MKCSPQRQAFILGETGRKQNIAITQHETARNENRLRHN